ncbi:S-adenosyl-L-methionine-dependent methyltransferase [Cylindrobasidium torrendii FP15055 ss-10]|uniref:Protein-lysine N-methyltransferase EFM4 n=1 Tax=Cylindrobasidium torrendii FP15055 ss-10 TaxID=1314674 RepID=A0A0D7BAM5_9AGAR|nr:S-adenosyl-L-methionine-dependent methyltransferase [Cylindrobasidium torrendii FP15055 ss-10]
MSTSIEPESSRLGTKQHWDDVYERELQNFDDDGDEGEVWFGEDSVEKMIQWAEEHVPTAQGANILEIGSGNGTLLFGLVDAQYDPKHLAGIDYSAGAVKLARNVSQARDAQDVTFNECDFLNDDPAVLPHMGDTRTACWDVLMDKGTYDAIALGEKDAEGRSPAWLYPRRAARLLKEDGLFLITSCNFTEDELKTSFVTADTGFEYHSRIQHRTFSFGGSSGSVVSSVAFKKTVQH